MNQRTKRRSREVKSEFGGGTKKTNLLRLIKERKIIL